MIADAGKHVGEPGAWINVVHLGGLCQPLVAAARGKASNRAESGGKEATEPLQRALGQSPSLPRSWHNSD
jgi:hypothetical protein